MYVCGGNTFYLMNKIRKNKFNEKILDYINKGKLYVISNYGKKIKKDILEIY